MRRERGPGASEAALGYRSTYEPPTIELPDRELMRDGRWLV